MALTNSNLKLIDAVASGNIVAARTYALNSLLEDKTKKNEWAVAKYEKMLIKGARTSQEATMPAALQGTLVGQSPEGFHEDRYYLRECDKPIFEDIRRMKLIAGKMELLDIPYRNSILLHGPSGTGKTEFGKYTAYKLRLPFFYVNFSQAIDSLMGNTSKNIHKIFDYCKTFPCVLMLDEIDCIAMKRASGGSHGADGELERTTISIMQELDALPNRVTLIAATNRLDLIDDALLRRFSIKHRMSPMSWSELTQTAQTFIDATGTAEYIAEETLTQMIKQYTTPGNLMPALIREIGKTMYELEKDTLEPPNEDEPLPNVFLVQKIKEWKITAETMDEALEEAKEEDRIYPTNSQERWEAIRMERLEETGGR